MTSDPRDIVGNLTPSVTTSYADLTTTNYTQVQAIPSTSGSWPYNTTWTYTYTDPRISTLEGEVRVLREMLAALLSGVKTGGAAPRKRTKK